MQACLPALRSMKSISWLILGTVIALLFTSLVVTTEPLDQQIVIPYSVTDADGDTDSDAFSVSFLNAAQMSPTTLVSDTDGDGAVASASMSLMSTAALVPGEDATRDDTAGDDWSAEQAAPADGGEDDDAGLVVTAEDDETGSSETPGTPRTTPGPEPVAGHERCGRERRRRRRSGDGNLPEGRKTTISLRPLQTPPKPPTSRLSRTDTDQSDRQCA